MERKNHTHLSLEERRKIFLLVNSKTPVKRIAALLCRHHSTIYRELARNTTYHEDPDLRGYFHMNADHFMRQRRQRLRRLYRVPALMDYVTDRLKAYWSPEQIAGYLKRQAVKHYACAETIYQYVYSDEGRDSGLYRYLFRGRPRRRRQYSRKPHDRVPAHHGIQDTTGGAGRAFTQPGNGHKLGAAVRVWDRELILFNGLQIVLRT